MPTNLTDLEIPFHPTNSHVIPALISRFHNAKVSNEEGLRYGALVSPKESSYMLMIWQWLVSILWGLKKKFMKKNTSPMCSHINVTCEDINIKNSP